MSMTPEEIEEIENLIRNASEENYAKIRKMFGEDDEDIIEEPSKSMSTDQYAKSREEAMLERTPIDISFDDVGVEKIEDEEDPEGLGIIMYSDFIEDQEESDEESDEESSSQYYVGDELDSQMDILKELENSVGAGKDEKDGKWYPHKSVEGGNKTIAYGHKISNEERDAGTFDNGLTEEEAIELLKKDIDEANRKIRVEINDFDSFPYYLRQELVNSTYRDLLNKSPKTLGFINDGDFEAAADEFTNDVDAYLDEDSGIKPRMDRVVDALRKYSQELDD